MTARRLICWMLIGMVGGTAPAMATLSRRALDGAVLAPPPGASLPMELVVTDSEGRRAPLRAILQGAPAVLLFADYTCRTLCRPATALVSGALAGTGLTPGRDYHLLLVGLDPKDTAADAADMVQAEVDPAVRPATHALLGGQAATALAAAAGYHAVYDAALDQYAHPAGLIVLRPTGAVSRVLSSLAVNQRDLRLALTEAGDGRIGGALGRLSLLCYGFDAANGVYTPLIGKLLRAGAAVTLLALALLAMMMQRRRLRRLPP